MIISLKYLFYLALLNLINVKGCNLRLLSSEHI